MAYTDVIEIINDSDLKNFKNYKSDFNKYKNNFVSNVSILSSLLKSNPIGKELANVSAAKNVRAKFIKVINYLDSKDGQDVTVGGAKIKADIQSELEKVLISWEDLITRISTPVS